MSQNKMTSPATNTQKTEELQKQRPQKWDKCLQEGNALMLGGTGFGTLASLMSRSFGPLLVMSAVGLYAAVDNCDKVFGRKEEK